MLILALVVFDDPPPPPLPLRYQIQLLSRGLTGAFSEILKASKNASFPPAAHVRERHNTLIGIIV